jgi:adenine-specific DNA-methyltransferase
MFEFDLALERIGALVKTFKRHESKYKSANYSEAEARKDFIDKFWIALGWDVNHDQQTNPYEQEVKVERGVATGGSQRRADYAFYLAPNFHDVRFFVEAKKPSGDIATMENYFQLIRYAWNSNTPLAVLTDFDQLHVLDCRYRPDKEAALHRTYKKFHYTDYAKREKFAEIYWLFSREAVADGSLEKRAKELPKPRGKVVQRNLFPGGWQSIDESFLAELDEYRSVLARTFKNRNPKLDSEMLTELSQRTLDRLVFLRFLEDKGIEAQHLVERFGEKGTAWGDFITASRRLDGIYNGIVYKHHDILDGDKFRVDDDAFADICENLAHINSPYDFNAIPIHILGSIYERFLGKVIVATDKRVKVEEKPEVRKAGGVYYTPEYIVRYIVQNTVGKLIARKTPDQITKMRFADIACGSGSFLLGVFDLLLKYHGHYFNENPSKARKGDYIKHNGKFYLSLHKKREILLNNIYGVDIDAQAVEVCQLSLYLKLLQEETEASTQQYLLDFEHTAKMKKLLPDLSKNIVCGNSLIGTDILDGELFSTDEERKLNPMNFEDAFPEVMRHGGFDAIVGNPPYGGSLSEAESDYFHTRFRFQDYQLDTYMLFLERAISLSSLNGYVGLIIPNTWLLNLFSSKIRQHIFSDIKVDNIVHYRHRVFPKVTVDTQVTIFQKATPPDAHKAKVTIVEKDDGTDWYEIPQVWWRKGGGKPVNIFARPEREEFANRLRQLPLLDDICVITQGAKPFQVGKGKPPQTRRIVDEKPFVSGRKKDKTFRPLLRGSLIRRYQILWNRDSWISFGDWLAEPRYSAQYDAPAKIVIRQTGDSLMATFDREQFIVRDNLYTIVPKTRQCDPRFILALINSRLLNWFYQNVLNPEKGEALAQVKRGHLAELPIAKPDLSKPADKSRHDEMVAKVEAMMEAKKQLAKAQTDKDKTYYENKCAALDRQIDQLVYKLYDLTPEEIEIVEKSAGPK